MNIKRILLTGARAPVTLHLARLFGKCGHRVIVCDSFPYTLCKYSKFIAKSFVVAKPKQETKQFIQDLQNIIKTEKIDLLIPTCEEVFYIAKYQDQLHCEVFVDNFAKMNLLHHKYQFIEQVKAMGQFVPATEILSSEKQIEEMLKTYGKVVIKPIYSRFNTKTMFVTKGDSLPKIQQSKKNRLLIQQFIEGKQYCSYSIAKNGQVLAHSLYKSEFSASGATIAFSHIHHDRIYHWVKQFVAKINYTGQIAFDMIVDSAENIYPIECNPRSTSGIHLFSEDALPRAFLEKGNSPCFPKEKNQTMITLAMLLYGKKNRQWLKMFFKSKDVLFSLEDVKPFFYQFISYYQLLKLSRQKKMGIFETTTYDIEWNGEDM